MPSEVKAALLIKISNLPNFFNISLKKNFTSSSFSISNFFLKKLLVCKSFLISISAATKIFDVFFNLLR